MVVECLPFRKYRVKLDGSGRVVLRNRKFLREYEAGSLIPDRLDVDLTHPTVPVPEEDEEQQQQPNYDTSHEGTSVKRLLPFNNPGLSEHTNEVQYRHTRSGREY